MKFYDPLKATNDPSYLSYSKEPDRIKANTMYGDLFKGVGELLDQGLKGGDALLQIVEKKDARETFEAIQADHTQRNMEELGLSSSGQAAPAASVPTITGESKGRGIQIDGETGLLPPQSSLPEPVRQDINNTINRAGRLQTAMNQRPGRSNDLLYNIDLNAAVRDLRKKYPGLVEQIDEQVKSVTGRNPANAIYNYTRSELDKRAAEAKSAQDKEEARLFSLREHIIQVAPDFFENRQKYIGKENNIVNQAVLIEGKAKQVAAEKAEIDLARTKGTPLDVDLVGKTEQAFTTEVGMIVNTELNKQLRSLGVTNLDELNAKLKQMRDNPSKVDRRQLEEFNAFAARLNASIDARVLEAANKPLTPGSQNTVASMITIGKVNDIRTNQKQGVAALADSLTKGETAITGMLARYNQWTLDATKQDLIKRYPVFGITQAVQQMVGGGQGFEHVLQSSGLGPALSSATQGAMDMGTGQILTGIPEIDGRPPTVSGQFSKLKQDGVKINSAVANRQFKQLETALTSKEVPPEMQKNAAMAVYADRRIFATIAQSDRPRFLAQFASPLMTEKNYTLGQQYPEVWTAYKSFVVNAAKQTFAQESANIQQEQQPGGWLAPNSPFKLIYNPGSKQVDVAGPPLDQTMANQPAAIQRLQAVEESIRQRLIPINSALRAVAPVFEKEKTELDPMMAGQLAVMGIQVPATGGEDKGKPGEGGKTEDKPASGAPGKPAGKRSQAEPTEGSIRLSFADEGQLKGSPVEQLLNYAGNKSKPTSSGSSSMNLGEIISMDVQDIPEGMSARDFIKQLQDQQKGLGKRSEAPLSTSDTLEVSAQSRTRSALSTDEMRASGMMGIPGNIDLERRTATRNAVVEQAKRDLQEIPATSYMEHLLNRAFGAGSNPSLRDALRKRATTILEKWERKTPEEEITGLKKQINKLPEKDWLLKEILEERIENLKPENT